MQYQFSLFEKQATFHHFYKSHGICFDIFFIDINIYVLCEDRDNHPGFIVGERDTYLSL